MPTGRNSLRRKGSPDIDNSPYNSQSLAAGGSALLDAINRGKVHLAKFILDAGECNVANTKDFIGKTPLIRACYIREQSTRDRAVRLLLSKGSDVNIQCDAGRTALSYACEMRCNDVVRILVKNNVDPDIPDNRGNTPLMYSALVGNDIAINILIRSFRRLGLQVDYINSEGYTALLLAAKHGNFACATMLALDGRACTSFRDRERGLNAEEWARLQGCSTSEVMPFSANALLYQQRLGRHAFHPKRPDDDDDEAETSSNCRHEKDELQNSFDVDAAEDKMGSFDFDEDQEKGTVARLQEHLHRANLGERRSRLVKRCSLPTMKLCERRPSSITIFSPQKQIVKDTIQHTELKSKFVSRAERSPTSLNAVNVTLPSFGEGKQG